MSNTVLVWRDDSDADTIHFAAPRTYRPETHGPYVILASLHVDPLSDLLGDGFDLIRQLKQGQKARVQVHLSGWVLQEGERA